MADSAAEASTEPSNPMDVDSAPKGEEESTSALVEKDEAPAASAKTPATEEDYALDEKAKSDGKPKESGEEEPSDSKGEGAAASGKSDSDGISSESDTSDPLSLSSDDDGDDDEDVFEVTPSDPTERILQAVTHKEEGNTHFKSGDLSKASRSYRKGTSALKNLNKNNTGDEQVKALLLSLQTNLSMVCYKQNKPKMSRDVATKALDVDSTNVKALYRRAAAHRKLGNIDAAKKDLKEALKHDPNNRDVKRELLSIKKEEQTKKKKEKESLTKQKEGLKKAFGAKQGSFLYNDKEEEEKRKKKAAEAKKKAEQEALRKRKAQWEDECVKRMSNDEPAISFEDWDKERKEKLKAEEKEIKRLKKEEEDRKKAERKAAREAAKAAESDSSDDEGLTEKEAAMLRGYKKTSDGRTTSYFSRELSEEQKAMIGDIAPQRLDAASGQSPAPVPVPSPSAEAAKGSAWNQAGTWEEKDTTEWCTDRLKSHLRSATVTSTSHTANVTEVKDMTGDASVAITSGKKRYIFDYHCEVKYDILDEGDDVVASGRMKLPDINSGSLEELEIEVLGWKKAPKENSTDATECRNALVDEIRKGVYSFVSDFNAQY